MNDNIDFEARTLPWIDTARADTIINQLTSYGTISEQQSVQLKKYQDEGYVIFQNLISPEDCDQLLNDYARLWQERPICQVRHNNAHVKLISELPEKSEVGRNFRINDFHNLSEIAANIAMHPTIIDFTKLMFNQTPVAMQSLFFEYGSEQNAHQDFVFVPSNILSHLCAIWVALEDIGPDQGPLIYYPGSHRIKKFDFGNNSLVFKPELAKEWETHMDQEITRMNLQKKLFHANKGDVLIWHGALLHGGSKINNLELTRKSFVVHYSDIIAHPTDYRNKNKSPKVIEKNGGCYYAWDHPGHIEGRYKIKP